MSFTVRVDAPAFVIAHVCNIPGRRYSFTIPRWPGAPRQIRLLDCPTTRYTYAVRKLPSEGGHMYTIMTGRRLQQPERDLIEVSVRVGRR